MLYADFTHKGEREHNEDSTTLYCEGNSGCFVLADGLGGHGMGEVASKLATETFIKAYHTHSRLTSAQILDLGFVEAQTAILNKQSELSARNQMKTTMVGLIVEKHKAFYGHIGDSRLYHFRKNTCRRLTNDHSVPQLLVQIGELTEAEIRTHPDKNRLLRVLGTEWEQKKYELCLTPLKLKKGDAFLMCSDGFWEYIIESDMERLLKSSASCTDWLERMIQEVYKAGKGKNMDNVSAIVILIE